MLCFITGKLQFVPVIKKINGCCSPNSDPERLAALPDAVAQRLRLKYEQASQYLGHRTL